MTYNDFIIPLAWPEAPVRTAGGPYDKFLEKFRLYRNGYYKAGHAAMLLVKSDTGEIDYFDFGRYISPDKNGRARSKETDPEVLFELKAEIKNNEIVNFYDIVKAIGAHPQTHGDGTLYAGIQSGINHEKAINFIQSVQQKPYTPYGPFVVGGTNCSRFVAQAIAASKKGTGIKFLYPWYFTPAPLGNIFYSTGKILYKLDTNNEVIPLDIKGEMNQFKFMAEIMRYKDGEGTPDPSKAGLNKITPPIERINISDKAQWLGGIGAGAWYEIISSSADSIEVKRTQGNGNLDFIYHFNGPVNELDLKTDYTFEFGSHGTKVIISQNGKTFEFVRV